MPSSSLLVRSLRDEVAKRRAAAKDRTTRTTLRRRRPQRASERYEMDYYDDAGSNLGLADTIRRSQAVIAALQDAEERRRAELHAHQQHQHQHQQRQPQSQQQGQAAGPPGGQLGTVRVRRSKDKRSPRVPLHQVSKLGQLIRGGNERRVLTSTNQSTNLSNLNFIKRDPTAAAGWICSAERFPRVTSGLTKYVEQAHKDGFDPFLDTSKRKGLL